MVLPISEVRRIVERVCARQAVLDACAERDLGYVIGVFEDNGLTQSQMASLTGLHQVQLSNYKTGKHRPTDISVFAAFAGGLGLPPAARQALGLDASAPASASFAVPLPRPAAFAEVSLDYPGTAGQAAGIEAGSPTWPGKHPPGSLPACPAAPRCIRLALVPVRPIPHDGTPMWLRVCRTPIVYADASY